MRDYDDSSSESGSDSSRDAKKREQLEKKKAKTKTKSSKVQVGITNSEIGAVDTDKRRKKEKKIKKEKRKMKEKKTKTKAKADDSSDSEESYAGSCSSAMGGQRSSAASRRGLGDVGRHGDSASVPSAGAGNAKTDRIKVSRKAARPAPSSSSSSSSDSERSLHARALSKQRSQSSLTTKTRIGEGTSGKGQSSVSSNDSGAGKGRRHSLAGGSATTASKSPKPMHTNQSSRKQQPKQKLLVTSSSSDSSSSDSDRSFDAADLKKLSSRFSSSTKLSKVGNASGPISSAVVQEFAKPHPKRASSTSKLTANESDEEKPIEDLNASSSRITVIDPMSRSVPRISRPPLPTLDGEPDWLFKPKEDKRRGFLGITELVEQKRAAVTTGSVPTTATSSTSAESKQPAKSLKKSRDKEQKTSQLQGNTSDAKQRLFQLLNQDPGWAEERALYNDDLAREIIKENPETAKEKYMFGSTKDEIYPLPMLSALHASVATLRVCHKAYPGAIEFNDQWIGTCLHFACAYRAPLAVLKYLVSKDDDQLEQKNQAGRLPMHLACMVRTPLEKIEFLYTEFKQALSIKDKDGMTPLHLLCNRTDPDVDVVSFLANKNRKTCVLQNGKGCTPLHLAVQHQTPINVLQALLAANNEVFSIPDSAGNLPLHTALQVNAENSIVQFCVWNYSEGLNHYNEKNERPIDVAKRIRKRDTDLHEILEPY